MTSPFLRRLNKRLAETAHAAWVERHCAGCGAPLDPSNVDDYCGIACRPARTVVPAYVTRSPAARISGFRKGAESRALPGTWFEDVDPLDVLEAADWRCELCGERIPQDVDCLTPLAATVDHHMPLALGGHHVRGNMRAAHRACNSGKNATHPTDRPAVPRRRAAGTD
ncbi:HNH endonuclease [Streptomyces sp. NPDC003077]|uniref:HNH endonuclease n=1 Tax=Streptomyces sp. NPDC003077 TaxID=3154443 RepID=UPI0033B6535B